MIETFLAVLVALWIIFFCTVKSTQRGCTFNERDPKSVGLFIIGVVYLIEWSIHQFI